MHLHGLIASQLLAGAVALNLPRYLPRDLSIRQNSNTSAHTIELTATLGGSRFHAPVTIGGETFNLLVDTGSSDTFVIEDDFSCQASNGLSSDLTEFDQSYCGYDDDAYEIDDSHTFERISNESFQAIYGAGIARGLMAFEDISLGGVEVTDQRFGLVNWSTPMNLGASGVLGLAYPVLTSAYELNGTIDHDNLTYQGETEPYDPLFISMYRRGLVAPYFSLALARLPEDEEDGSAGQMVLGGIPDVTLTSNWTTVPAEFYADAEFRGPNGTRQRSYWATTVQALHYGDDEYTTSYQAIVDSGAPMTYVPRAVAEAFNDAFSPSATWNSVQQGYIVDCDASPPDFALTLNGTRFDHNPTDLIIHTGVEVGDDELCLTAVTRGLEAAIDENDPTNTTELYIVGASFLKTVVAVFDFGNSEMRFAQREDNAASALEILGAGKPALLRFCQRWKSIFPRLVYTDINLTGPQIVPLPRTIQENRDIAFLIHSLQLSNLDSRRISRQRPYYDTAWADNRVKRFALEADETRKWIGGMQQLESAPWAAFLLLLLEDLSQLEIEHGQKLLELRAVLDRAGSEYRPEGTKAPLPKLREATGGIGKCFVSPSPPATSIEEIDLEIAAHATFGLSGYIKSCRNLKRFSFRNLDELEYDSPRDRFFREEYFKPLLTQKQNLEVLELNYQGLAYDDIFDPAMDRDEVIDRQPYDRWFGSLADFPRLTKIAMRVPNLVDITFKTFDAMHETHRQPPEIPHLPVRLVLMPQPPRPLLHSPRRTPRRARPALPKPENHHCLLPGFREHGHYDSEAGAVEVRLDAEI
ncbi:aspartic peptidase domain-containing protein [Aspergillus crustosus]